MEAFSLFCTVFINALIVLGLLVCIYLYFFSGLRALRKLKPSCYISYNKNHFDKDFEFKCEFCGSIVSSKDAKCPKCAGDFGKNKEYLLKKRAMHQKYLQYIKVQEDAIEKEIDYISNTLNAIKRYKLIRHKYLNFEIGNPPVYKPASDYEFTCEYLEADQNIRNEQRDARVDERYRTPIKLAEEKGNYIALFIIFVIMIVSAGITFMILQNR